jgi:hypothetical protein
VQRSIRVAATVLSVSGLMIGGGLTATAMVGPHPLKVATPAKPAGPVLAVAGRPRSAAEAELARLRAELLKTGANTASIKRRIAALVAQLAGTHTAAETTPAGATQTSSAPSTAPTSEATSESAPTTSASTRRPAGPTASRIPAPSKEPSDPPMTSIPPSTSSAAPSSSPTPTPRPTWTDDESAGGARG